MKYLYLCLALPNLLDVTNGMPSHLTRPWGKQNKETQRFSIGDLRGGSNAEMKMGGEAPFSSMLRSKFIIVKWKGIVNNVSKLKRGLQLFQTLTLNNVSQSTAVSNLVYSLGDLRQIVLDHGANFNEEMTEKEKKENNIVEFDTPALVITKKSTGRVFQSTLLKHEVTADNVLQFIKKNRRYLTNDDSGKIIFDTSGMNTEPLPIEKKLEALKGKFDADIIEFDDDEANKGLKSQLLYGIVVNR